jgi:hypothetical protein
MLNRNYGVLYIATGPQCREEALRSVRSLKQHCPQVPAALISDIPVSGGDFDHYLPVEKPSFSTLDKVRNIHRTPFERTIFLDSDTFIMEDISELFDLLNQFDMAFTLEVARGLWYRGELLEIPDCFGDLNGGFIVFRRSEAVMRLLRNWWAAYLKTSHWLSKYPNTKWIQTNDQPSLRQLLWDASDVRFCVLPSEYNALTTFGTSLWGKVKIVHSRGNADRIGKDLNHVHGCARVYMSGLGTWQSLTDASWRHLGKYWLKFHAEIAFRSLAVIGLNRSNVLRLVKFLTSRK